MDGPRAEVREQSGQFGQFGGATRTERIVIEEEVSDFVEDDVLLMESGRLLLVKYVVVGIRGQPQAADRIAQTVQWKRV